MIPRLAWAVFLSGALAGCTGQIDTTDEGTERPSSPSDSDTTSTGDSHSDSDSNSDSDSETHGGLFAPDRLATVELTLSQACLESLAASPYEYCSADLRYRPSLDPAEDVTVTNVGVRLKGRGSFRPIDQKASFKIKLDEFAKGQRLFGLRRLTLNNMVQDPGMVRERLGYWFYREAGVIAPRCNHVRLVLNGELYGLYANVETLDDEFVESLFVDAPGNLYDIANDVYFVDFLPEQEPAFELETNQDVGDRSDLAALIASVNGPDETFFESAGAWLDWDAVLTAAAAQAILADWDGYFGARNNYKLYHELDRDRFIILPWGIDQTFGLSDDDVANPLLRLEYPLDASASGREPSFVFQRCLADATCAPRYNDAVQAALTVWNELPLREESLAIEAQIDAATAEDPRQPYSPEAIDASRQALHTFLEQRGPLVAADLAQRLNP